MERILRATELLLARASFAEISVADIVRLAETSVGAFYARFPKKEDLLPALYARRYGSGHRRRSLDYLQQLRARSLSLDELAKEVTRNMVAYYDFNAPLLREMDRRPPGEPLRQVRADQEHQRAFHDGWAAALLTCRDEVAQSEAAVRFALFLVSAACREAIVYPERSAQPGGREELEQALSLALVLYLRGTADPRVAGD